jgi:hypothetical protein
MVNPTWEELDAHHVAVRGDQPWQRRLRLLQARWREEMGLHIGTQTGREGVLGSRIEAGSAERCYSNFLTDTIREVVRATLEKEEKEPQGKLIRKQRLLEDLLSSQPMCFNLFGELQADLVAATAWARQLWPDRVETVTLVDFEYSPGRSKDRYLGNRTAFDVYVEHTVPGGAQGFIAIESKYHEDLAEPAADTRERVFDVARGSGLFAEEALAVLAQPPFQQIWFDHLLALSMLQADKARWGENGLFVFLHPAASEPSYRVVPEYQRHLKDHRTFQRMTLEECVGALQSTVGVPWVDAFGRRYLGWGR